MDEITDEDEDPRLELTEILYRGMILIGLGFALYEHWDFIRRRTEVILLRRRVRALWDRANRQRLLEAEVQKDVGRVIYQALQTVEEAAP